MRRDPGISTVDAPAPAPSPRVESVDALRGLTILLMVFVNDLGPGSPSWMRHIEPSTADGMTLADVVFPWFLFIVGVSIPLAFERAFARGATLWGEIGHIAARTASLLLMGVVSLNGGANRSTLGRYWGTAAFVAILLAWSVVPREPGPKRRALLGLKGVGAVGLLVLLAIYRRDPVTTALPFVGSVEGWVWMRTGWWGILGLIGWAYLTVAFLALWLGGRREWLAGALGCLILFHLSVNHQGGPFGRLDDKPWLSAVRPTLEWMERGFNGLNEYVNLGQCAGSLAAITMAGCLLGSILGRDSDVATPRARVVWTLTFIIGLTLAGAFADTFEGINKIAATPTWSLWSSALAAAVWLTLYLLMDVAGRRGWSIVVRPAGANPLVAFFLHPILLSLIGAAGLWDILLGYKSSSAPAVVVAGSLAMALLVCALTGLLARIGLRVKL